MKYSFTKLKSVIPNHPFILKPMLDINLLNGTKIVSTKGLIDTGADGIVINIGFAKQLDIIAKSGIKGQTIGVGNLPVPIFYHTIGIEIPSISGSRFPMQVSFIDSGSVGVLLGRIDFLDRFKISFEMYTGTFDIELKP